MWTRGKDVAAGAVIAVSIALAGCGSGSTATGVAGGSVPVVGRYGVAGSSGGTAPAPVATTTVVVAETDFSITLPRKTFSAGTYTFHVSNQGEYSHNLTVEGPGVDKAATPTLQPSQSSTLTVTLMAGTYELWCSVDSHKDKGMDVTITVT